MNRICVLSGCALMLCGVGQAFAGTDATGQTPMPDLRVERSAFVLRQTNGRILKGAQLKGLVLNFPVGGESQALRLASITPDPDDADILRHEFQVQDEGGRWQPACEPNIDGETWGFPVALPAGHPGREGAITLTCASGAVAKCIRYGYKPWGKGRHGESLVPYHAACVHMIRADYAGDGTPHTKPGTLVQYHDAAVHWRQNSAEANPEYGFEAGWSPQGAVCVARVRWPELGTLDAIRKTSERLAVVAPSDCTEARAKTLGALIFNRSHIEARIGE